MHAIEKELTKLLKIKADSDEDRQKFLERLIKGASSLDDEVFYDLAAPTQEWVNGATKAVKAGDEIPDFEEVKERKVRAKDDSDSSGDKKPKEKRVGMSSVMLIRHYLVDNPEANTDEIVKFLESGGHKVLSTVAIGTVRSDFRGVVRVLQEKGLLKRDLTVGKPT